jgi:hypothetical protein
MLRFLLLISLLLRATPAQEDHSSRQLKRSYGGSYGGTSRPSSGGSTSSFGSYSGTCCQSRCCSSGYRTGSSIWWYRGYRPSQQEGDDFEGRVILSYDALNSLLALNSTNSTLLVNDCATIDVNQTALDGTESDTTLKIYLQILADRLLVLQDQFNVESDIRTGVQEWLDDFERIQPCLENFQSRSDLHAERVLTAQERVGQLDTLTENWEAALASSSGPNTATWASMAGMITLMVSASLMNC